MNTVTYIFVIIALMICCFVTGFLACFIAMMFHKKYVVIKQKEEDEFEYDEED